MIDLACPSKSEWNLRRQWFDAVEQEARGEGTYLLSEHACALTVDLQLSFCAGAWSAVIVLAMAIVDAVIRETSLLGFNGNTKDLLDAANVHKELQHVRLRRNALVHSNTGRPCITVDDHWSKQVQLETDARRAIELMFGVFYGEPGT